VSKNTPEGAVIILISASDNVNLISRKQVEETGKIAQVKSSVRISFRVSKSLSPGQVGKLLSRVTLLGHCHYL